MIFASGTNALRGVGTLGRHAQNQNGLAEEIPNISSAVAGAHDCSNII